MEFNVMNLKSNDQFNTICQGFGPYRAAVSQTTHKNESGSDPGPNVYS